MMFSKCPKCDWDEFYIVGPQSFELGYDKQFDSVEYILHRTVECKRCGSRFDDTMYFDKSGAEKYASAYNQLSIPQE